VRLSEIFQKWPTEFSNGFSLKLEELGLALRALISASSLFLVVLICLHAFLCSAQWAVW
jgi:hypothetical protein